MMDVYSLDGGSNRDGGMNCRNQVFMLIGRVIQAPIIATSGYVSLGNVKKMVFLFYPEPGLCSSLNWIPDLNTASVTLHLFISRR